jgi:predicted nuclease of predicted toxin-antitoxin system
VKLLVDMNLSPSWIERLAQHGFEAVHWSTIGAPNAGDDEILSWARVNGFVLLTHDLDFSAILAATSEAAPSVVQLRMQDLLSERALEAIVTAVNARGKDLELGALMSIDESGARVRILPLRQR